MSSKATHCRSGRGTRASATGRSRPRPPRSRPASSRCAGRSRSCPRRCPRRAARAGAGRGSGSRAARRRMLKTPSSRFADPHDPVRALRAAPRRGRAVLGRLTLMRRLEAEEAHGVLAHDLAPRLGAERQAEEVLRMVEVVVRPVGGEHRLVLAVEQLVELDDVRRARPAPRSAACRRRTADVVARPLLQQRHLPAPLDVLLVEPVQRSTGPSRHRPP